MTALIAAVLVLALGAAACLLPLRNPTSAGIGVASQCIATGLVWTATVPVLFGGSPVVGDLAWAYPVGTLRIRLDALGAFFLVWSLPMTLLGSIDAVGYLSPYFESKRHLGVHYSLLNLTSLSFVLVYTGDHALIFLLGWEIAALAAWLLVIWDYTNQKVRFARFNYLVSTGTCCTTRYRTRRRSTGSASHSRCGTTRSPISRFATRVSTFPVAETICRTVPGNASAQVNRSPGVARHPVHQGSAPRQSDRVPRQAGHRCARLRHRVRCVRRRLPDRGDHAEPRADRPRSMCALRRLRAGVPSAKLTFTSDFQLASTERGGLMISASRSAPDPVKVSEALRKRLGRSLKLRSVSAGGCNGCELEPNALTNVNFDIGRYGIDIVASPRHADGLVLTGPITRNMAEALQLCWDAMPEPKLVIAVGAGAISGSPFEGSSAIDRSFLERFKPTLYVPGCPPHPLTFVCGILDLLGIAS